MLNILVPVDPCECTPSGPSNPATGLAPVPLPHRRPDGPRQSRRPLGPRLTPFSRTYLCDRMISSPAPPRFIASLSMLFAFLQMLRAEPARVVLEMQKKSQILQNAHRIPYRGEMLKKETEKPRVLIGRQHCWQSLSSPGTIHK